MKYKFTALFEDGKKIIQNDNDQSQIDPSRSAYFDVVEEQKNNKLLAFGLYGEECEYLVDLRNGQFCVNGRFFQMHEEDFLQDFRLIYFRKNTITFSQSPDGETKKEVAFQIGWQTTFNNENYKNIMTFY